MRLGKNLLLRDHSYYKVRKAESQMESGTIPLSVKTLETTLPQRNNVKQVEGIKILCSGQGIETTSTRVDIKLSRNCFFHLQN